MLKLQIIIVVNLPVGLIIILKYNNNILKLLYHIYFKLYIFMFNEIIYYNKYIIFKYIILFIF
jgi:hypothetical protein